MSLHGARATVAPWERSTEAFKREITPCFEKGFKGP